MQSELPLNEELSLVKRICIVLANQSHLERAVDEAFQISWVTTQNICEHKVAPGHTGAAPLGEAAIDFETAVGLTHDILSKIHLKVDKCNVRSWVADACRTFALSRDFADAVTEKRIRFIVDWVLRSVAEQLVRRSVPRFYARQFLIGFDHDTNLSASGLQLSGPVAYGVYGNIWLHAKMKFALEKTRVRTRNAPEGSSSPQIARIATTSRQEHVVISVSKHLCRAPPEILSRRLRGIMHMERLPYLLPLVTCFEDLEYIHLVYDSLSPQAICAIDKIFDDMHNLEEEKEITGLSERAVQKFTLTLLTMIKPAHARGWVHGSLRMGCCYLNDQTNLETLQVLEFGLYDLFNLATATPPLAVLTPLTLDPTDPVPPYRRDFQCIAEMTYLMLGGQSISSIDDSEDDHVRQFKRGAISFADKVHAKTSEYAKSLVTELIRPVQFRKKSKIEPCQEVNVYLAHRWFSPALDGYEQLDELYDVSIMRRYDKWRNMLRLRATFLKILADHASLRRIQRLKSKLLEHTEMQGKVSWWQLVTHIQSILPAITYDLLKKVNKAFGDNTHSYTINTEDVCRAIGAWRRKRIREVLWQLFSRHKAFSGELPVELCIDGLTSGVIHVWSRPLRVIDVLFPSESGTSGREATVAEEVDARIEELLGYNQPGAVTDVSFVDLVARTDAAEPLLP
eukprot:TRINITY_DN22100_c0_g1_i1.p1 TRINITY_DN22100_c0_g1~~TRINITY_DN22100_c0_g1_i1.p1  ORF type:complete len:681 (+),score=100.53 TRINITY_DN22100_c0_g1_i1:81-2123(+)